MAEKGQCPNIFAIKDAEFRCTKNEGHIDLCGCGKVFSLEKPATVQDIYIPWRLVWKADKVSEDSNG